MAIDHGTDFSCVTDIDAELSTVSGRTCLLQAIARRLITPRGGLLGDTEYGYDCRIWIGASHPRSLGSIASAVAAEARKDERVLQAEATVEFDETLETMTIVFRLSDADGPFDATITISDVTVELILEGTALNDI